MAEDNKITEEDLARFNQESWAAEPEASPQAIFGKPEVSLYPLPGEGSPFNNGESAFGDLSGVAEPPASNRATPLRTLTASMAMVGADGVEPTDQNELVSMVEQNLVKAQQLLEDGEEYNLRLQSAVRETERRIRALGQLPADALPGGVMITPQLQRDIMETVAVDRAQNLEELARTALEEEALQNIQTYMAAGDEVAVRSILQRMDPDKNTTYGVIKENLTKSMIIANAIEKAELDEGEESLLNSLLTAITSVPEFILLGDMFRKLGNVDKEGGHESSWWKIIFPYDDYAEQINRLQSMSATELAEYLPEFLENVRGNATTWGLTDKGTIVGILHDFKTSVDEQARQTGNFFHWLDVAGIVPFTGLVRGASRTTELIMGVGVRKQAADRVAAAIDLTVNGGESSALKTFGITGDEIIEHALPTAINPGRMGSDISTVAKLRAGTSGAGRPAVSIPRIQVSLSGEISDTMAIAREVTDRLRSKANTFRHFTPEETAVAVRATVREVEERVGSKIADYETRTVKLASGQVITQADVVINKPFATAEEAAGFLRDAGYGADVTNVVTREIEQLAPALKTRNGEIIKGEIGQTHGDVLSNFKINADEVEDFGGFVTPKGEYLSREDALKWVQSREGSDRILYQPSEKRLEASSYNLRKLNAVSAKANKLFSEGKITREEFISMVDVVEDVSGQFFPRVTVDVGEAGFYTNPLSVPEQFYVSRWILNPSQTSDTRLFEQQTKAGQLRTRLLKKVEKDLVAAFRKLGRTERVFLDQVLLKGANMKKWFSDAEFNVIWERSTGAVPSDNVQAAYRQYKINNDVEWIIRNAEVRSQYVVRGFEEVDIAPLGVPTKTMGIVNLTPKVSDKTRYFDVTQGKHLRQGELTQERLDQMVEQGYVLVKAEEAIELKDGTRIDQFLVKKSDMETNPIAANILEYVEGGHRLYAHKNFVKQARSFKQPDELDGTPTLERPNVFRTAKTMQEAKLWADTMNRARLAVLENGANAQVLDETIFQGRTLNFPTGEEFMAGIKDGTYTLDHPFEAVFDRELPSAYSKTPGGQSFLDEEEPGFGGFYRTNGRLYYSHKGEHLRAVDGELSPTLDAFQAQSNALYNVAQLSSFSDFKTSAIHRWVNTYRSYLNFRAGAEPAEIFNEASLARNINPSLASQIEGQRASIQRVLNFRSDFDLHYQNALRGMHEWIAGDADNAFRRAVSKAPLFLMDRNPVGYLRGWAFDLKLGLFNIGQFVIQTSTMFSAMALSPRAGWKGFRSYAPTVVYHNAPDATKANVLDLMVKRGMHKMAGFDDPAEFKRYIRFVSDSGFLDFGDTHILVNNSNPASTFSIQSKIHAGREMGRFFFYQAEVANRSVAMRIAYEEAVERFGKKHFNDMEFEEFVRGRAENYSFNMSETSRSAWQQGLLSVPTQFWAYNIRMAEALTGKNFTPWQKLRLGLFQMGVAGSAGIPLAGWLTDYYNSSQGSAPHMGERAADITERNMATLQRGFMDRFIYELTGADVQVGARWGTGDFFHETIKNLMGLSQYGEHSFGEVAGGATFSIMGETLGSAWAVGSYWMTHESGGNDVDLSRFEMESLLRQVSTINNVVFKAWFAENYGIYQSIKGRTLVSDLPPATAPFIAFGFAPGELRDREAIMAWRENKEESVKEAADFINRLWSESVRQPDKMEENARMVNEFVRMLPDAHRTEVLNRVHLDRDPSDYDRLLRLRQTDRIVENFANEGNEK